MTIEGPGSVTIEGIPNVIITGFIRFPLRNFWIQSNIIKEFRKFTEGQSLIFEVHECYQIFWYVLERRFIRRPE